MRILVACRGLPWPIDTGARQRLHHVVRALTEVAPVDIFAIAQQVRPPNKLPIENAHLLAVAQRPAAAPSKLDWGHWLLAGALPYPLWFRHYSPVMDRFMEVASSSYALCWFSTLEPFHALREQLTGPSILDLFDLEDHRERTSRSANQLSIARRFRSLRNEDLWRSYQQEAARSVSKVIVCSDLDRERLGASNVAVIPNGYERTGEPVGRTVIGNPPTVLFVGFLRYEPNIQAAKFLVTEVAPRVWKNSPEVHFRIVGDATEEVFRLASDPRIKLTGRVEFLETELRGADVSVVPVRSGSGTRIKIIEAFAHRIPVVTTRLGAEGLTVEPGKHLLFAESAEEFASKISGLLHDARLRNALVSAAHEKAQRCYRWEPIRDRIAALAQDVLARP